MPTRPTVAILTSAVVSAGVYLAAWAGYRQGWRWLDVIDSKSLQVLHQFGINHASWVQLWVVVSALFSPSIVRVVGVLAVAILMVRHDFRAALLAALSLELSYVVEVVAKHEAHRARPASRLVHASSSAFPSGHAMVTVIGVLLILVWARSSIGRRGRTTVAALGAAIVVAVGFGRVALNVHNPSDVLAGWALGYSYFVLCLLLTRPRYHEPAAPI